MQNGPAELLLVKLANLATFWSKFAQFGQISHVGIGYRSENWKAYLLRQFRFDVLHRPIIHKYMAISIKYFATWTKYASDICQYREV